MFNKLIKMIQKLLMKLLKNKIILIGIIILIIFLLIKNVYYVKGKIKNSLSLSEGFENEEEKEEGMEIDYNKKPERLMYNMSKQTSNQLYDIRAETDTPDREEAVKNSVFNISEKIENPLDERKF